MRQRRPKNLEEKIKAHDEYLVHSPEEKRGAWRFVFDAENADIDTKSESAEGRRLFLEIGSGKGRFINELAKRAKDDFFIGFEGQDTVILRALEKIKENKLTNLMMCQEYINEFTEIFGEDELDGIYLNFSDPWPKERHEKRRLTSAKYLEGYASSLKPGAFIKMKTDNDGLFAYSTAQFKNHPEFDIIEYTEDINSSPYAVGNIRTEYEEKFLNFNKKINYICVIRK